MLDYNDQRLFDMPLQPRSFPYRDKQNRHEDRPKQIERDAYRIESMEKENGIKVYRQDNFQGEAKMAGQVAFRSLAKDQKPGIATTAKKNRNENLRSIINRQLFSNQKNRLNKINPKRLFEEIEERDGKENKPINRYQQLLREVYGEPKPSKPKMNKKVTSLKILPPNTSVQRNASSKDLTIQKDRNGLERYRSETDLHQRPFNPSGLSTAKSSKMKIEQPTYLQLYKQKRRPFLFL